jgi:hypothetical protein
MSCPDCERAIAQLRAEFDAFEQRHEQQQLAMLVAMREILKELEAKNQTLFAGIDRQVRDFFTRFEAVTRSALDRDPRSPEEPPKCH